MRWLLLVIFFPLFATVRPGVEEFFTRGHAKQWAGKRVGLITNQTGIDRDLHTTAELFRQNCNLVALFAPEHGLDGSQRAEEEVQDRLWRGIPVHSLHGKTRRPTAEMLDGIDLLVFDIQDVGTRCYTYTSTLFYAMEEAAKQQIPVVVLDRPNPINGLTVDGPMVEEKWRSFIGYIDVPMCHGMTVGELARFFNAEYNVGCDLQVVRMRGWRRSMTFADTGLPWVPTSPHIPEAETPLYYPATGLLGDAVDVVSIGIGYTLPFKVVGAPWISGEQLASALNNQNLPGVRFQPYIFTPFFGRYKDQECRGIRLVITDSAKFRPVTTQFMIMGLIKSLYPREFAKKTKPTGWREQTFYKLCGSEELAKIIDNEPYIAWQLIGFQEENRKKFLKKRDKYLLY
jgi:uncharacterized protein YbbC (DUF1343 family)